MLTGLGRVDGKRTSGVDLSVLALYGDGAKDKVIGVVLSGGCCMLSEFGG